MYEVLNGVRILELAAWTFVPACGGICADWGADVIKIEPVEGGDPQRYRFANQPGNVMMDLPNRGKRSIALDLRSPDGRAVLADLVRDADVLTTSYLPAARRRLGIDVDQLRAINPKIIVACGSGQGSHGPEAAAGGYDMTSAWARSGMCHHMTGNASEPPPFPPAMLDLQSGFALAAGVAGALFRRERSGIPSVVDVSLLSTGMWMMGPNIMAAVHGTETLPTSGRLSPPINPVCNSYRARDGRWFYMILLESERYWADLCTRLGRSDLIDDPRYATPAARDKNKTACVLELDAIFARHTLDELTEIFDGMPGPWAKVQNFSEVIVDPQVVENGYIAWLDDPDNPRPVVSGPVQFDRNPVGAIAPTPELGEDTEEILRAIGYAADRIDGLRTRGVVR